MMNVDVEIIAANRHHDMPPLGALRIEPVVLDHVPLDGVVPGINLAHAHSLTPRSYNHNQAGPRSAPSVS